MQSRAISNAQVTAFTQWDGNLAPFQARLHHKSSGSWSARTNDVNQWLQIDLGVRSRVTRVGSQGRYAVNQWVTKYKLQYGEDGTNFKYYVDAGKTHDKVK